MQVNPGDLKKRISFVEITYQKNANGFKTLVETVKHSCYAQISNTSGTKVIESGATFTDTFKRFLIRYSDKVKDEYIIKYQDKNYKIEYINNYGDANEYLEIFVNKKEIVNGEV